MRRFFFAAIFCIFSLSIPAFFKRFTQGFKLAKMHLEMPFCQEFEVPCHLFKEQIYSILSQKFTYLARGAQCYVFASQDDQYVIKLFRYDRSHLQEDKIRALFNACLLAYTKAQDETGVLFLHLNPTHDELPFVHLKGPLGQSMWFALDDYRFVIQKKVESFDKALLKASKDESAMQQKIDAFLNLLNSRVEKGISNLDPSLHRNFGFLGDRALEIDFGNYTSREFSKEKEIRRYVKRFRKWLNDNAPEWVSYLDSATQASLQE